MTLLTIWNDETALPPHARLTHLLVALGADNEALGIETLGARNRRLLALHDAWIGGAIEAQVACAVCATANSFSVPKAEMLALASPETDAIAELAVGAQRLQFRLPTMRDIAEASDLVDVAGMRSAVLMRCVVAGATDAVASLDEAALVQIEDAFDQLDPLANIMIESACSGCGATIVATVDIATFVAADIDRMTMALLRDIHSIASAYGWSEAAIAALPAHRRARYVAMIGSNRQIGAGPQQTQIRLS